MATVEGNATDDVCLDHATYMVLDNYNKDIRIYQPEIQAKIREIDQHYDRVSGSILGNEQHSGFLATMYTPKSGNGCPPTLALRGTVFEDARGIAIMCHLKAYPAFDPSRASEISFGIAPELGMPPAPPAPSAFAATPLGAAAYGAELAQYANALGEYTSFVDALIKEGNWLELFAEQSLNTTATSRLPFVLPLGLARLIPEDYRTMVVELKLEVWLNQDQGDWATNVLQGIGQNTIQYDTELKQAVDEAMDIADNFDKQLRITGHSLGGGLASAAALYAIKKDPEMKIYGLGYDSAGLHGNTVKNLNTSFDLTSDAKIRCRAVEDEALTSMEKPSDFVPIASSLIRFTGSKMPPPVGAYDERKGVSPGPVGTSVDDTGAVKPGRVYAAKGQAMPNLFDLGSQTLVPSVGGKDPLATFGNLAGIFANSSNLEQVLSNLNAEIANRVQQARAARDADERAEEAAEAASEAADAAREAALEREEAAAEAASEAREAEAEAAAAAAEAQAEAEEPTGIAGYLYNRYYDNPRDNLRAMRDGAVELADEVGDLGSAAGDEIVDLGRELVDEAGDGIENVTDAAGDGLNLAYEYTAQYLVEFANYGLSLGGEFGDYLEIMGAFAAYHSMELATFTFVPPDRL
jgi:hypothetical protein